MMKHPIIWGVLVTASLFAGCGDSAQPTEELPEEEKEVTENTSVLKVNRKLIVIPSPLQMSALIKSSGAPFDKEMLSTTANVSGYSTSFKQAINLGVYGAGAGYASAYNQSQAAMDYMGAINKLAGQLDLSSAFGSDITDGLKNSSGQEAMMNLVSTAYKSCEQILNENERGDVAAMIAAGAWIESMHCALQVIKKTNAQAVIDRVGDQKTTLTNLLKLIGSYYSKEEAPEFANVVDTLYYISQEFEQVYATYKYVEPTTDAAGKKTVVNSTNDVHIKPETLANITELIEGIRKSIIS